MADGVDTLDLALFKNVPILYVEDDPEIREGLMFFLNRRFDTIHVAANGREGLELYRKHKPGLVVTDIKMPIMDGLEMAEKIKAEDPMTPIVITTAFNDTPFLMKAIELKIDGYVKKPIEHGDLLDAIHRCVTLYQHQHQLESRNRIIQTIIDWEPHFVILSDGKNNEYLNERLLRFLGYATMEEFLDEHRHIDQFIVSVDGDEYREVEKAEWFRPITDNPQVDHIIYLKSVRDHAEKACLVKYHLFSDTGIYIFAFIDPDNRNLPASSD